MKFQKIFVISAVIILASLVTACRKEISQSEAEHEATHRLKNMLALYELENAGVYVTNLAQVFSALKKEYPHYWHKQFSAYGMYAGFKNSFYEKYMFLPLGATNQAIEGEFVFLNAEPFPDGEKKLGRMVASRVGGRYQDCRLRWFREERIEKIFREAGIEMPKPVPMPPPPPAPPEDKHHVPLSVRLSEFFAVWADHLGLGADKGWVLQRATFSLLLFLVALASGWFAFKWVRRRRD